MIKPETKLKTMGLDEEQQLQLTNMIGSMTNSTEKLQVEVMQKKERVKIKVKAENGLSDDELRDLESRIMSQYGNNSRIVGQPAGRADMEIEGRNANGRYKIKVQSEDGETEIEIELENEDDEEIEVDEEDEEELEDEEETEEDDSEEESDDDDLGDNETESDDDSDDEVDLNETEA